VLKFQWQRQARNGGTFTNIRGAKSACFTLALARRTDNRARFRVIVSNANGRIVSAPAKLSVIAGS
jgi:hypothetical protein